ncbi:MAG: dNTP triphosphohydrolase [Sulfurovaceae bacterium]
MYNRETKEYAREQEQQIKCLEYRFYEIKDDRTQNRQTLMRDYARVLYSSSFRRLQGKMQLLGIDASKFNRNRLTHSLEVAQIARTIAFELNLKDTVVTETAALIHDIGNPPYGHYGEKILNELSSECGGYEGNAQAFRIIRILENKHHEYSGLNLNIRTLMSAVKYFFTSEENPRKFLYEDDYTFLKNELAKHHITIEKSIDAQIMDLADEIAYAAHDLEDAISFGMISLGEIVHEFRVNDEYGSALSSIRKIAQKVHTEAAKSNSLKSSEEYLMVLKKELTSTIVNTLCSDIGLIKNEHGKDELGYKNHALLAEGLKKLLFNAILRKKDIQHYEKKGEKVIRGLFEVYSDETYNKDNILLPPELRKIHACKSRIITDYISGMMDSFATQEYEKYFGKGSAESLYFK